ncbi:unnamed protein product [Linum tenue]|uniref:F-box domain-containing protein n=1 Tax=Linum tenue TaxID=586396 RepID=A0AAV0P8J7_9ROSI|nr:unnamed protein product [Linum tenue]
MAANPTSDRQLSWRFLPCSSTKRRRIHSIEVNSSPPPTTIVQLGDDVLVEILIRLPNPRSACSCKAVCKGWKFLISDPIRFNRRFVSHHQSKNRQPILLLPSDDPQAIITSFIPMTTPFTQRSFAIMDSYKDLVLCGFADLVTELYRSYFLCNPFTKQWVALPLAPEMPIDCGHYFTRLVCEPLISNDLDLGEEQVFAYSSEYRFRVVCLYRHAGCTKINMFCSDTGEWTKDILVLREHCQFATKNVVSCNREVFWCYYGFPNQDPGAVQHAMKPLIAAFNPFRPDVPPTTIEPPTLVFGKPGWDISFSQGAMHVIVFEDRIEPGCSQIASSVWRLEEDRKSWGKVCDGLLKGPRLCELRTYVRPCMHPEKPQVFFLRHSDATGEVFALSCDLGAGVELELFAEGRAFLTYWNLFRAELSCWPTLIPRYKQLRVLYDGSYSCWVQISKEHVPISPIAGTYFRATRLDNFE